MKNRTAFICIGIIAAIGLHSITKQEPTAMATSVQPLPQVVERKLSQAEQHNQAIDQYNRAYYEACLAKASGVQTRDGPEAFCTNALNIQRSTQIRMREP